MQRRLKERRVLHIASAIAYYLALAAIPLGCGLKSIAIGEDINYDMSNYHFYDSWAFLKGRLFSDIFVAGSASLVNPLPTIPTYYLETHLNPELAGFIIGAFQGLAPLIVALIVCKMMGSRLLGLIAGATAAIAGGFASELGNDMGDSLVAPFLVLAALFAVMAIKKTYEDLRPTRFDDGIPAVDVCAPPRRAWLAPFWYWLLSGLAAGIGSGLKLAELPEAVGLVLASFLIVRGGRIGRFKSLAASVVGLLAGLAATNTFWTIELTKRYGDPFVFLGASGFGFVDKFTASTPTVTTPVGFSVVAELRFLWSPITAFFTPSKFAEIPVKEASLAIAVLLLGATAVLCLIRFLVQEFRPSSNRRELGIIGRLRASSPRSVEVQIAISTDRYVIVAFLITLFLWFKAFQIYRYLIPLEVLGAVVIISLLRRSFEAIRPGFVRSRVGRGVFFGLFAGAALISMLTAAPSNYWIRAPFSSKFAVVPTPAMLNNGKLDALIEVGDGGFPADFILPYLKGRFIGIGGNNILQLLTPATRVLLDKAFDEVAADHGNVIAYWRNVPNSIGPTALVNALSPYPLRPRECVSEIMMMGGDQQSLEFCRFVKAKHRPAAT